MYGLLTWPGPHTKEVIFPWSMEECGSCFQSDELVDRVWTLLRLIEVPPPLLYSPSNFHISEFVPSADTANWQGIIFGGFLAFFAYIGFEDMVNVAEEVKNPQRNLPLAIILAVSIATVVYLSIAIVAVHLASPDELVSNDAPLSFLFQRATGSDPWLISIISIFAVINGALIQIIMASRMLYGMSRKKLLPSIFGRVHPQTRTPLIANFTIVALVMTFALFVPLVTLASVTSFVLLMVFILINLALINIKRRVPAEQGIRVYPLWVPVMGALSCCALVVSQLLPLIM